jgi:hypothetical protein
LNLPPCFFAGTQLDATLTYDGSALLRDVVLALINDAARFRANGASDWQELDYAMVDQLAVESDTARCGGALRAFFSATDGHRDYKTNRTKPCDIATGNTLCMKHADY